MKKEDGFTQTVTTVLAYALPVLQFFFNLLSEKTSKIFLFRDYFLVVSIFTAVVAYIMILAFKATPYLSWAPFQNGRRKRISEWNMFTDRSVYDIETIAKYQNEHKVPKPLWIIDSNNIVVKVFIPLIIFSFIIFFTLGLMSISDVFVGVGTFMTSILSILQSLTYAIFIVSVVLAFAHQFLQESSSKKYKLASSERFDKAVELARVRNGFGEYKQLIFIEQRPEAIPSSNQQIWIFYLKVGEKYFIVLTDYEVNEIITIKVFNTREEADNFISTPSGATV